MAELDNPDIFRSILETLPTGVYLVDRNRKILFWNAGAEIITGYLRQDVVGRFLREHLLAVNDETKDLNAEPFDPLNLAFRDGKSSSINVSILHKQGYRVPIALQTVPIRDAHGAVIGVTECFEKTAADRTRRQVALAELECLDGVTGIPTQTFMEIHLREQLATFAERHAPLGILLVQVDDLDRSRSMRGPGVVPAIQRVVAQTIENSLRPTDLVGCWTENRFVAVLMECKQSDIQRVGNRIRTMIGHSEIEWWGEQRFVTASFGGAGNRPGDTVELLIQRAETALDESMAAGGNCVRIVR